MTEDELFAVTSAHDYLSRLLVHYAPQCEALPSLLGVCTQIDNLLTCLPLLQAKAAVCDALMQDYDSLAAKLSRWPSLFKLNDAIDRLRELQETGK